MWMHLKHPNSALTNCCSATDLCFVVAARVEAHGRGGLQPQAAGAAA
jgi:hypothetical protein